MAASTASTSRALKARYSDRSSSSRLGAVMGGRPPDSAGGRHGGTPGPRRHCPAPPLSPTNGHVTGDRPPATARACDLVGAEVLLEPVVGERLVVERRHLAVAGRPVERDRL